MAKTRPAKNAAAIRVEHLVAALEHVEYLTRLVRTLLQGLPPRGAIPARAGRKISRLEQDLMAGATRTGCRYGSCALDPALAAKGESASRSKPRRRAPRR